MLINIHKFYLLKKFSKKLIIVSTVFFALVLIVNLIEESNFLKNSDTSFLTPLKLTLLNSPSLLYEMFPFIFLITTQFFFIEIIENKEIYTLRQFGLDNFDILKFLSLTSFLYGILIITLFYNLSSIMKNQYLKIKNEYTNDNKYLAVITKNGLWIKDSLEDNIIIINADKIDNNYLINASITSFNKSFQIEQNIISEKIDIKEKQWILYNSIITYANNNSKKIDQSQFKSNFDQERINNLFSDLNSLTFFELEKLKKDYKLIGYSIDEINIQKHKFYSLPFLLMIMTIISMLIMINNRFKKKILLNLLLGIFISVLVYYISHFSSLLGENGRLPIILSIWFPVIVLFIISTIGMVRLNEK